MNILQAIILSIVEGLTEFLPVSSTGHLILSARLLSIPQTEFVKTFEIVIQLGAILAVVFLYWKTLLKGWRIWWRVLAAFIPTALIGFLLYDFVKGYLLESSLIPLLALFIGGVVLIVLEQYYKQEKHYIDAIEDLRWWQAGLIGIAQAVAMIPGVSRSAASIFGGLFVGLKRSAAVEFSFLIAIPTMAAASGLDLLESNLAFSSQEFLLLGIGFVGAFLTALAAVKYFVRFVQSHTFIPFGVYRIVLALVYWLFLLR